MFQSMPDSEEVQSLTYHPLPKSVFGLLTSSVPVLLSPGSCPFLHLCLFITKHLFSAPAKTPSPLFRDQGWVSFGTDLRDCLA